MCTLPSVPATAKPSPRYTLTINLLDIYTAPCVMILRREIDIMRGIGRVVLKVEPVLGPGIASLVQNCFLLYKNNY